MKWPYLSLIFITTMTYSFSGHSRKIAAVAQLDALWDKAQISVCFGYENYHKTVVPLHTDGSRANLPLKALSKWDKDLKSKIKGWITSEYTPDSTNVHFVGWSDCGKEMKNVDAAIFLSSAVDKNIPAMFRSCSLSTISMIVLLMLPELCSRPSIKIR